MVTLNERLHSTIDKYEAKDFSFYFERLDGMSEEMLTNHHHLYEGYIKKVNEILDDLKYADKNKANHNYSEDRSLLIDLTHNLNGVILHELYFSNLSEEISEPEQEFKTVIERDFGSWANYIEDIKSAAKCARGWAITAYNYRDGKIRNFAIDGHNINVPVFVRPLLVVDVWEHAYTLDYGTDKPAYIDAFFENTNWSVVSDRFEAALKHELGFMISQ
ncbi:MAG: superoxide dismutase [Candidatus Gastranaerophilales bacterium]|nr:superoxide dismutase [Candidatus Gastranaerophilales bacterium]